VAIGGATMVIAAGALLGMEESVYPGWPMRLDSMAGDLVIMFPTYAMEWETGGDLRTAFADVPLADYAFDLLGTRPAPRGATDETIRFVIVGQDAQDAWQQYMDMRSKLARIGRGRLWVRDASGNRYWAYVRPDGSGDDDLRRREPASFSGHVDVSTSFRLDGALSIVGDTARKRRPYRAHLWEPPRQGSDDRHCGNDSERLCVTDDRELRDWRTLDDQSGWLDGSPSVADSDEEMGCLGIERWGVDME
jgi:hypothetical protein